MTLEAVAAMAHHEADTGAPGGMVAVYVELALRHLTAQHDGPWNECTPCHSSLHDPWPVAVTGDARPPVVIDVVGLPAPQGSKRHVGRGIMVESSKRVRPWREAVKQATLDVLAVGPADEQGMAERIGYPFDRDPVSVTVVFRLPRPASHYRTGANAALLRDSAPPAPAGRPDVDKLLRSTLDALGEAGLWRDDCQVVQVTASKAWAGRDELAGAAIEVRPL